MKVPVATSARAVGLGQLLGRRRRRKHERKQEEAERHAEAGAEHAAEAEDREPAPEAAHVMALRLVCRIVYGTSVARSRACQLSSRCVITMRDPRCLHRRLRPMQSPALTCTGDAGGMAGNQQNPAGGMHEISGRPCWRVDRAFRGLLAAPALAQAQAWPSRTITLVVPFAAGGGTDAIARVVAEKLAARLRPAGGGREQGRRRERDRHRLRRQGRARRLHAADDHQQRAW